MGSGREGDLVVEHFGVGAVADDNAGNGIAADVVIEVIAGRAKIFSPAQEQTLNVSADLRGSRID